MVAFLRQGALIKASSNQAYSVVPTVREMFMANAHTQSAAAQCQLVVKVDEPSRQPPPANESSQQLDSICALV